MKSNVFAPWLANLRKPVGPAPKALPDHQFYMRHPQHKEKVAEEYRIQYPQNCTDAIKERNRIAAELLKKEPEEVREALKREAAEELTVAKEKHEEAKRGLPSDVPEDIEEYVHIIFFRLI
jgi:hypothetical protein